MPPFERCKEMSLERDKGAWMSTLTSPHKVTESKTAAVALGPSKAQRQQAMSMLGREEDTIVTSKR
jgi:hypothetical protein